MLYPDELVSQLCEEIAYEKGAVSLAQLWNIAETVMGVTALDDDEPMQRYILQSLFSDPEVLVMDGEGNSVTKSVTEIDSACVVSISEEKLWQVLTGGYSKRTPLSEIQPSNCWLRLHTPEDKVLIPWN